MVVGEFAPWQVSIETATNRIRHPQHDHHRRSLGRKRTANIFQNGHRAANDGRVEWITYRRLPTLRHPCRCSRLRKRLPASWPYIFSESNRNRASRWGKKRQAASAERTMTQSSGGKTYDTSDGSEQPHASSTRSAVNVHPADRWADDGAPPRSVPAETGGTRRKPPWSILSLPLLGGLLRLKQAIHPAAPSAAEPTDRQDGRVGTTLVRGAAQAAALKEYYRNAWEHT
jgi:hypothetical protein